MYSDHEYQWIRHRVRFLSGADAGPDLAEAEQPQFEPTTRGLDTDELAELREVYVSASTRHQNNDASSQSEVGEVIGQGSFGINLDGGEFLRPGSNSIFRDVDGSGTDDLEIQVDDQEEPGLLGEFSTTATAGFVDATNGPGGSGSAARQQYRLTFGPVGSGPVVDRTDDLDLRHRLIVRNQVTECLSEVVLGLRWRPMTVEGGRAKLAFPSDD